MIQHFTASLYARLRQWFDSAAAWVGLGSRLTVVRSDDIPEQPSRRHFYVIGERGEDWFAAMLCPCGCGEVIELNLVPPGRPCWRLVSDGNGAPTLSPSVWREVGCRAHFFLRQGRVVWVTPEVTR